MRVKPLSGELSSTERYSGAAGSCVLRGLWLRTLRLSGGQMGLEWKLAQSLHFSSRGFWGQRAGFQVDIMKANDLCR